MSPSVSELLLELGAGFEIVAADAGSLSLPGLGGVVNLGELHSETIEDALASQPDLAIGLATPRVRDFAAELEERGIVVHLLDPRNADAVIRTTHRVGDLLERPTRAISVSASRIQRISELAGLRDGKSRLNVAWLVECDPLLVIGGSGLAHEVLELAGAENSFHQLGFAQVEITQQQLAEKSPDVVLDSTGREPERRCWDRWSDTTRVEPTPGGLAELPGLDLHRRIREIHTILYDDR